MTSNMCRDLYKLHFLCCSLHTGWKKTRPAQKLLARVKFTGNTYLYRTRINVNAPLLYWTINGCVA